MRMLLPPLPVEWGGLLAVILLLAPGRCGGNLPAAVRSTAPMNSAAGCGDIARTAQHECALRATALTAHGAPVCSECEAGATIGIARDADGMWMRFLCEACHGLANSSYAAESCGSGGLHALGLAGRCAKCRTKASYGAPLSPPQRCLRHKEARDIARSLGSSCVVDGCKKARLFGSRGGVPLCARCICSESCWNSLSRFTSGSMLLPIRMTSNTSGSCNSIRGETRVRTRCGSVRFIPRSLLAGGAVRGVLPHCSPRCGPGPVWSA